MEEEQTRLEEKEILIYWVHPSLGTLHILSQLFFTYSYYIISPHVTDGRDSAKNKLAQGHSACDEVKQSFEQI